MKKQTMADKIVLITGGTSGIGKATINGLVRIGATVVFTYRNNEKADSLIREVQNSFENAKIYGMYCDLASFKSIRDFAQKFMHKYSSLDVLINNAGVWETERNQSKDNIEMTFAVNHLAPFLLTDLLLPKLKLSEAGRIINVSSGMHFRAFIDFENIEGKNIFDSTFAYSQSKLANILFTNLLAKKLSDTNITVNSLMPGFVATNLFEKSGAIIRGVTKLFAHSPTRGARTSIYLASSDEVSEITGKYFENQKLKKSSPLSRDEATARKLWDLSEQYISNN